MEEIARHYGLSDILTSILDGLAAEGKDIDELDYVDLAPVDEFHIRGRLATAELAALANVGANTSVLDVGSGLGGSSRYLAKEHGCTVTGIDLTPEYCEVATDLSQRVGLAETTEFHCGSALEMPFDDNSFDLAWTQHVQMNIEDKAQLYAETFRVLKPGGRFVFHDILAGPGGDAHYPCHWAETGAMSHLIAPDDLKDLLQETGFDVGEWRDKSAESRDWFLAAIEKRGEGPPPNLGLHLLLGDTGPAKFANVCRNLTEQRITVFQGSLRKP